MGQNVPTPWLGELRLFAGNFAPQNWVFCKGQLLNIEGNEALFDLLGTQYGGAIVVSNGFAVGNTALINYNRFVGNTATNTATSGVEYQ